MSPGDDWEGWANDRPRGSIMFWAVLSTAIWATLFLVVVVLASRCTS